MCVRACSACACACARALLTERACLPWPVRNSALCVRSTTRRCSSRRRPSSRRAPSSTPARRCVSGRARCGRVAKRGRLARALAHARNASGDWLHLKRKRGRFDPDRPYTAVVSLAQEAVARSRAHVRIRAHSAVGAAAGLRHLLPPRRARPGLWRRRRSSSLHRSGRQAWSGGCAAAAAGDFCGCCGLWRLQLLRLPRLTPVGHLCSRSRPLCCGGACCSGCVTAPEIP